MTPAWRLRTEAAMAKVGEISWTDLRTATHRPVDMTAHGDVAVARRDIGTSYHLSVVIDDAMDGVTLVTRGADLEDTTLFTGCCRPCLVCRPRPITITNSCGMRREPGWQNEAGRKPSGTACKWPRRDRNFVTNAWFHRNRPGS